MRKIHVTRQFFEASNLQAFSKKKPIFRYGLGECVCQISGLYLFFGCSRGVTESDKWTHTHLGKMGISPPTARLSGILKILFSCQTTGLRKSLEPWKHDFVAHLFLFPNLPSACLTKILLKTVVIKIEACRWEFWKERRMCFEITMFSKFANFSSDQRFERKIKVFKIHGRRGYS